MAMLKLRQRLFCGAISTILLAATGFACSLSAQSDSAPSVAEAAKRAREQKKNAAKPGRTVTDDNLPKPAPGDAVNVLGTPPPAADDKKADAAADAGKALSPADADKAKLKK